MLKAEQIPNAAWIAMQRVIGDHVSVATQKEAIAAALNAWPGMRVKAVLLHDTILLPLPPEKETSE